MPEDITGRELDRAVRGQLAGLSAVNADVVARHLVAAGRLLEDDAEAAYAHAVAARGRAGRVAAVREAAGIAAYLTRRWAEALSELRAARRMSGSDEHLPLMADCERGLGRPERALELAGSPPASTMDLASRIELRIVAAGARRELGQLDASVLTLTVPELESAAREPWLARLRYAYADALLAAGRRDEAIDWFARAAAVDEDGSTGAGDRLAELQGVVFVDTLADENGDAPAPPTDGAGRHT